MEIFAIEFCHVAPLNKYVERNKSREISNVFAKTQPTSVDRHFMTNLRVIVASAAMWISAFVVIKGYRRDNKDIEGLT